MLAATIMPSYRRALLLKGDGPLTFPFVTCRLPCIMCRLALLAAMVGAERYAGAEMRVRACVGAEVHTRHFHASKQRDFIPLFFSTGKLAGTADDRDPMSGLAQGKATETITWSQSQRNRLLHSSSFI